MKTRKLMAVALCAAAFVTTTAFAEEDSLVASAATMSIADPVNPKPGMLFKGYNFDVDSDKLQSTLTDKIAARTTTVVKSDQFSIASPNQSGVWEGYLKCNRSAKCTILVERDNGNCVLFVNGKCVARLRSGGNCVDYVDMKAGFNHVKLFASHLGSISVSLKPAESTKDPKPFSPKDLFYDEKPETTEEAKDLF